MNKQKPAEEHQSESLKDILQEITAEEQLRIENKMQLAAKIDDARIAKGWSQSKFAAEMGKKPSEISKWLSGTHNFTSDTLWDIEEKLCIELIALKEHEWKATPVISYRIEVEGPRIPLFNRGYGNSSQIPTKRKSTQHPILA